MADLFQVTIDFETSHMIFPRLIGGLLLVLGACIAVTNRRAILGAGGAWARTLGEMDKFRFFGTVALTIVYFLLMVPIGDIWPNTGLGFLICSIPFVALTGLLFMHERTAGNIIPILIVAAIVPTLVWWLFTYVFALTLP